MPVAGSLRRLHVVLAGADRRFLRVAAFLLARRGHLVTTAATPEEARDVLSLHGADAVVMDGGPSPRSAVDVVGEIETLYPGVGVILVLDGHHQAEVPVPEGSHVLSKWKSARTLAHAVEGARAGADGRLMPRRGWRR